MKTKVFFLVLLLAFLCPIMFAQAYSLDPITNPDTNNNTLNVVWAYDDNNVFAGGDNQTLLKYDGVSWSQIPITFPFSVFSIYGSSPTDVWLMSIAGTLAHYNGVSVTLVDIGNTNFLLKIYGFSVNSIYLCGDHGTVKSYDGSNWTAIANSYSNFRFASIWGTSGSNLYFCGNDLNSPYTARIIHYDGSVFTELKSFTGTALRNIWSPDNNTFYISGGDALYVYNKTSNDVSLAYTGATFAFHGFDANNIVTSKMDGFFDSLMVYNGSDWKSYYLGCAINSAYSPTNNPNNVFLVGDNGVIFHLNLTVGITENIAAPLKFSTYPNPATGQVTIDLAFDQKTNIRVDFLNLVGQQVKETSEFVGNELQKTIDLNDLPSGIYFIKVTTVEGSSFSKKLIITK